VNFGEERWFFSFGPVPKNEKFVSLYKVFCLIRKQIYFLNLNFGPVPKTLKIKKREEKKGYILLK